MTNAKQTKATNDNTSFDVLTVAKSIGENIVDLNKAVETADSLTKTLQETADKLRKAGIVFGKSVKSCTWRKTISDTITAKCDKASAKTCMNYVTSFVKAVNEGTKFSLSDSKGEAKGKGKGKGKDTAKTEFSTLLANAFNHEDFAKVMAEIQTLFVLAYDADESPKLTAFIADYLKQEGFEIDEK